MQRHSPLYGTKIPDQVWTLELQPSGISPGCRIVGACVACSNLCPCHRISTTNESCLIAKIAVWNPIRSKQFEYRQLEFLLSWEPSKHVLLLVFALSNGRSGVQWTWHTDMLWWNGSYTKLSHPGVSPPNFFTANTAHFFQGCHDRQASTLDPFN